MQNAVGTSEPVWLRQVVPDFLGLLAWVETLPGTDISSARLRICESSTPGAGNAVVAGRDIPPGGLLARVPVSAFISLAAAAAAEPFAQELVAACRAASLPGELSPLLKLRLYLIHARHRPDATHHAYVRNFPVDLGSPLVWNDVDLAHLDGTPLAARVNRQRAALWEEFRHQVRPLVKADPVHFPEDIFTFRALVWAQATCSSRALPPSLADLPTCDFLMCPVLDLFNHRTDANVEWLGTDRVPGADAVEFRVPAGNVGVSDGAPVRAGQEVWSDYGAQTDEDFLMGFGFCPESNRHNKVDVYVLAHLDSCSRAKHAAEMERRSIPLRSRRCRAPAEDTMVPAALCAGPFPLSRASGLRSRPKPSADVAATLRLPMALLAAFDILLRGAGGDRAAACDSCLRDSVLAAFVDLLKRHPLLGAGGPAAGGREEIGAPGAPYAQAEAQVARRRFSDLYRAGQRTLLEEGLKAVEAMSQADVDTAVKRFFANSRFLDRLEAKGKGSPAPDAGDVAEIPGGTSNIQASVEGGSARISLCLIHELDDQAGLEGEDLEQMTQHLFGSGPSLLDV
eukprot:TRINITY_DN25634_c0_g1_i1.p1 TRINITY_DN25634_c0_g1~~TRINITY_DN25634_c0_g1_i1.p1  ORF type:complete len:568 (+),score=71.97 TRINITY_DN25634_c0_g1_i1:54-1757(+)